MRQNCKTKLFLLFFVVSFSFLILDVKAIEHINDINFSWIQPLIYENDDMNNFDYDNETLSLTTYNNTNYYEHLNDLDNLTYDNDYYLQDDYDSIIPNCYKILKFNNSFYSVIWDGSYNYTLMLYDEFFNLVNNDYAEFTHEAIISICTDKNFIYTIEQDNPNYFYICKYDFNFNLLEQEYLNLDSSFSPRAFDYYDYNLYVCGRNNTLNEGRVFKYDMDYDLIEIIDVDTNCQYPQGVSYYQNYFYLFDSSGTMSIEKYDTTFSHIEQITTVSDNFHNFKMYDDLVFAPTYTNFKIYNISFVEEITNYNDLYRYFPDDYGLLDPVDNLNVSMEFETYDRDIYHYNASYSFKEDAVGTIDTNIVFVDSIEASSNVVEVLWEKEEHRKVINHKTAYWILNDFGVNTNTTQVCEFWYLAGTITTSANYIQIRDNDLSHPSLYIQQYNGGLRSFESGVWSSTFFTVSLNTWYHFRIVSNIITEIQSIYINDVLYRDNVGFAYDSSNDYSVGLRYFRSDNEATLNIHYDGIGLNHHSNYTTGNNRYEYEYYFHNNFTLLDSNYNDILGIECNSGNFSVNGVDIFNIFEYQIDANWIMNFTINQQNENGTLSFYNLSSSLIYAYNFTSLVANNIKYIKYSQFYSNYVNEINITNFSIFSNDTKIVGNEGYLSYTLDDLDEWIIDDNSAFNISGYGIYDIYVSNDTYSLTNNYMYLIAINIELRDIEINIDIPDLDISINNPVIILNSKNGHYLLDSFRIYNNVGNLILYDDRGYYYSGTLTYGNININNSYYSISSNRLNYQILFNDSNEEYLRLTFDIVNFDNTNYQLLYDTYCNSSISTITNRIKILHNDVSYQSIDIQPYYNSGIEVLEQDKITSGIEFEISDDDLYADNTTITGYIDSFTFNYSETITFSLFIDNMLIMLIPLIIILSLTFSISYALNKNRTKEEPFNRSLFFPIFLLSSILVFAIGFFDTWILFSILIATIIYLLKKREDT